MKSPPALRHLLPLVPVVLGVSACVGNAGTPGNSAVTRPPVNGTIFTIVFENHDQGQVLNTSVPYFTELANTYGQAKAYLGTAHPSLPNYIEMVSGSTQGIADDNPPSAHPLAGTDNLADQLDGAHIPWRAYMETMGQPCGMSDSGQYAVRHNPFVYFTDMSGDAARCAEHNVDFDANFANDLAANTYRFMWITPNVCNDMHDCSPQTADAWLHQVVPQIMASPGYQNGGAIFILFDEGPVSLNYILGTPQNLAAIVISPKLVSPGYQSNVAYDHKSYLATVEDILGLPRLPNTAAATPMSDFFSTTPTTPAPTGSNTGATSTSNNNGGSTSP
jgi:acid phosphatase